MITHHVFISSTTDEKAFNSISNSCVSLGKCLFFTTSDKPWTIQTKSQIAFRTLTTSSVKLCWRVLILDTRESVISLCCHIIDRWHKCLGVVVDIWLLQTIGLPGKKMLDSFCCFFSHNKAECRGKGTSWRWPICAHHPLHSPHLYRSICGKWRTEWQSLQNCGCCSEFKIWWKCGRILVSQWKKGETMTCRQ